MSPVGSTGTVKGCGAGHHRALLDVIGEKCSYIRLRPDSRVLAVPFGSPYLQFCLDLLRAGEGVFEFGRQ